MKTNILKKSFFSSVAVLFLVVSIFAGNFANAQTTPWMPGDVVPFQSSSYNANPVSTPGDGLGSMALNTIITWLVSQIYGAVMTAVAWAARLLDSFIQMTTFLPPQVEASWTVVKNFVNMFFILVLIVIAFGTIFGIEKYSAQGRGIIVSFLIAAILVNFSFAIGKYVLDIGNGLTKVFLNTINQESPEGISATLQAGLAGGELGLQKSDKAQSLIKSSPIISGLGIITFLVLSFMAFISAAIFVFVRIPFVWFLLIISPLAWFSYALPSLRAAAWSKWWKNYLCWCFFLPTYIFILMFGVVFINAGIKGPAELSAQQQVLTSGGGAVANIFELMGINGIFFYAVTIIFMVGGLPLAKSVACAGGDRAMKIFGGIESGVKNTFKGAGRFAWRASGGRDLYEGTKEGLKARGTQIKEKGIFGIGGEQASRLRQAAIAEKFGGIAARGVADKQLSDEVTKLKNEYERITDTKQLRSMMDKGSKQQQLAIREILKSRDDLTAAELAETFEMYGGSGSLTALKFARGIDYGAMSSDGRKYLFNQINDAEIKKKIALVRADKEDYKRADSEELKGVAQLFVQDGDKAAFLNKVRKTNMKNAVEALTDMGLYKIAGAVEKDRNKVLENAMSSMNLDSILEISAENLKELRKNSKVDDIIKNKITKENLGIIKAKANKQQLEKDVLGELIDERELKIKSEEQEKQSKQAETQQKGNEPLVKALENFTKQLEKNQQPPQPGSQNPPPTYPSGTILDSQGRPMNKPVSYSENEKTTARLISEENTIDLRKK